MILVWTFVATAAPLTLDDVLGAVDRRIPDVAQAEAAAVAADAAELASRAPFDPTFRAEVARKEGEYPSWRADLDVAAATPWGPKLSGGWMRGVGSFPAYDGDLETSTAGEAHLAVSLPLLRDLGSTDAAARARAARAQAEAARSQADDARRRASRAAADAYWAWVEAGRVLAIERSLLDRAITRSGGLWTEVERGARARVDALDNDRILAAREARVADAEAKLVARSQALGLWYRDVDGRPSPPDEERLPPVRDAMPPLPDVDQAITDALAARPDLTAARDQLAAASVLARRAARALLPDVSSKWSVHQDLGDGDVDVSAGLGLGGSFAWRGPRAERDAATAREWQREEALRGAEDAVRAEVTSAHAAVAAAARRLEAAERARALSVELLELERRRVELGASDLFRLVLREEQLDAAARDAATAEAELGRSEAGLRAAIGR
jgi:outer membrane protein TolC